VVIRPCLGGLRFSLRLPGLSSEGALESSREWLRSTGCAPSAIVQSYARMGLYCFALLCSLRLLPLSARQSISTHSVAVQIVYNFCSNHTRHALVFNGLSYQAGEQADGCSVH